MVNWFHISIFCLFPTTHYWYGSPTIFFFCQGYPGFSFLIEFFSFSISIILGIFLSLVLRKFRIYHWNLFRCFFGVYIWIFYYKSEIWKGSLFKHRGMDLDPHHCGGNMCTFLYWLLLFHLDDYVGKFSYQVIDIGWYVRLFLYIILNYTNQG